MHIAGAALLEELSNAVCCAATPQGVILNRDLRKAGSKQRRSAKTVSLRRCSVQIGLQAGDEIRGERLCES